MKTIFIATHVPGEFSKLAGNSNDSLIEMKTGKQRLILADLGKKLPSIDIAENEVLILLYHGDVDKLYGKYLFAFFYDCGTNAALVESKERKVYMNLLESGLDYFDHAWRYFFDHLTEQKLDFLHKIYQGERIGELPADLSNPRTEELFDTYFKDKKYVKTNREQTSNLANLRDEILLLS